MTFSPEETRPPPAGGGPGERRGPPDPPADRNEDPSRFILDSLVDATLVLSPDGTILFANPAGASLIGLESPADLVGRSMREFLSDPADSDDPKLLPWGGVPVEYRLRTVQGEERWAEGLASEIVYGAGTASLVTFRDITRRKHAEQQTGLARSMGLYDQLEQSRRIGVTEFIVTLSNRLLHLTAENAPRELRNAVASLGAFVGADRAYLQVGDRAGPSPRMYAWCAPGIEPCSAVLEALTSDRCPWWMERMRRGEAVRVPSADALPRAARAERAVLESCGVQAILAAPLVSGGIRPGQIGLESVRHPRHWTEEELVLIRVAGELFTYALERNRAEETLRESEERFRMLIEHASDIIVLLDMNGHFTYASPSVRRVGGYAPDSLLGRHILDLTHPDDVPIVVDAFMKAAAQPWLQLNLEVRIADASGTWHLLEVTGGCLLQGDEIQGFVVNARDITERKRIEAALRESEEKYRKLVELAADAILVHRDGTIVYVNPAGVQLLRASDPAEVVGREILSIVHPKYRESVRGHIERDLEGVETPPQQLRILRLDGTSTWVEGRGTRTLADGRPAIQIFFRDISDRKQAEEALREYARNLKRSNEDLERFAYVSSHDLQEPLRTIVSFSQLLERQYRERLDASADEYIDYIVSAGKRMQHLINDLLEYSRVTTRGGVFMESDSGEALEQAISNLHTPLEEAGVTITHTPLPPVMADPPQLAQVFQNLISNAVKYRREDEPPTIHVSGERRNGYVLFCVADNGIGIEPQYFDRIFVIFQRLHGREKYSGTGIGLAVVKRIVERHGGAIWVESEPGKGTTFFFTLPEPLRTEPVQDYSRG